MHISLQDGIVVENKGHSLILDPHKKMKANDNSLVCVSHAHSDHIKKHDAPVLSTAETADLFPYKVESIPCKYGKPYEFDGMTIRQFNANHILGSSQFEIKDGNETVCYTGDFRMNESSLFGRCDVVECDTLIIESTYGLPHFKFPTHEQVSKDVETWVKKKSNEGKNLLFGSYSLGKSQEIISIMNEMGVIPVVHPKVAYFSGIYNKHGHDLQFIESGTDEGNKMLSNRFVAIMPPNLINPEFINSMQKVTDHKIAGALLTGWGMMYNFGSKGIEKVFPMSDHADFYQILDYVKKSGAKKVLTVHGYSNELASYLKKNLKIEARSLE